ncbi:lactococcin 972 family bacteriocin [Frigoribacterium sp. PhB24]|uniref:lactococcin 972 family bacteriocin n=1 Tax=Frigoribacterium sp. PhB24 TaxID=2485204 RepID=UPI000FC1C519|nr:lactococcin 972 family bacteriocin [Frigoribacterium sp. PhB24]ROS50293.1 lactococcin 972-like bacteriocin [Frigoribacterium sp. PhB24]
MKILSPLATGALAVALLVTGTTAANAEALSAPESTVVESGSMAVQSGTRGTTASVRSRGFVVESSWTYGTKPRLYSNYFHRSRWHGSSVKTAAGRITQSANTSPGQWSFAYGTATPNRVDYAYYRITS